jgi:hypothetical protein
VSECDLAQQRRIGLFVTQLIALTAWIAWGNVVQPSLLSYGAVQQMREIAPPRTVYASIHLS